MPLLSTKDHYNFLGTISTNKYEPDPTFGETLGAAFSYTRDEGLSISAQMNIQGYEDRRATMRRLRDNGFDVSPYIDDTGAINYDQLAEKTGLVKSDIELYRERRDILAKRREESQDVMARGNGFAQFMGMTGGYMTDPINAFSVPFGGVGTVAKGMSVLSRALIGARNASAVAIATESAIQPLVYRHKHDIGSPYDVDDALAAIGYSALGAGLFGGAIGGVSGYFARLAENTAPVFKPVFPKAPMAYQPPMIAGKPAAFPTPDNIVRFKQELIDDAKAKLIGPAGQKLTRGEEKKLRGELRSLKFDLEKAKQPPTKVKAKKGEPARVAKQKVQRAEVKRLEERIARTQKLLDDSLATREYNKAIVRLEKGMLPPELQKRLDDYINTPSNPEGQSVYLLARMAENMRLQKGFRAGELALQSYGKYSAKLINSLEEAKDAAIKALDDEIAKTSPGDARKLEDLQSVRDRIANATVIDGDELNVERVFKELYDENIQKDLDMLRSNEAFRQQMEAPTLKYDDFVGPPRPDSPKADTTPMQRQGLDDEGLGKDYDTDMNLYNQLETKLTIDADGKIVDAEPIMKEFEKELDGLNSIMRCSIG